MFLLAVTDTAARDPFGSAEPAQELPGGMALFTFNSSVPELGAMEILFRVYVVPLTLNTAVAVAEREA